MEKDFDKARPLEKWGPEAGRIPASGDQKSYGYSFRPMPTWFCE